MYTNPWSAFKFQPTLPVRGVTSAATDHVGIVEKFQPRSPRAGSDKIAALGVR